MRELDPDEDEGIRVIIDQLHHVLALLQEELAYHGQAPPNLRQEAVQRTRRALLLLTGSQEAQIGQNGDST